MEVLEMVDKIKRVEKLCLQTIRYPQKKRNILFVILI